MTESEAISKLLNIAKNEIGYKEKASNASLDDKSANAGGNNYTKYARDLDNISGFYNGKKNGYAWCDMFVDWCFVTAFGSSAAMQMLYQPTNSAGAGCLYSCQYYKNNSRFFTSPKAGDQIFFLYGSEIGHTGIVESVSGTTVTTIEGNTSDQVARRTYSIGSSTIYGYGRPYYGYVSTEDEQSSENSESTSEETSWVDIKYGDSGDRVKELQNKLISLGYSCGSYGADGSFGLYTKISVMVFQIANDLSPTGVVDSETWEAFSSKGNSNPTISVSSSSGFTVTTASSVVSGTCSTGGEDDEKVIWDYLYGKIQNAYGTAALMGNLFAESALRSNNLQDSYSTSLKMSDEIYTKAVDNGTYKNFPTDSAGYGLAQWTSSDRKANLLSYVKGKSKSIGDLNTQLEFLYKELSSSYAYVLSSLKNATSVLSASNVVLNRFEIPYDRGASVQKQRAGYGQTYYDKYAKTGGAAADTTTDGAQSADSSYVPAVGDIVMFSGDTHYLSASANNGNTCKPGKAKISLIHKNENASHPYHLIRIAGGGSTVYGWVDRETFTKA